MKEDKTLHATPIEKEGHQLVFKDYAWFVSISYGGHPKLFKFGDGPLLISPSFKKKKKKKTHTLNTLKIKVNYNPPLWPRYIGFKR
jgi:hypothetical protein